MKVECWAMGKTQEKYLAEGISLFDRRLRHYLPFEWVEIPDLKNAGKIPGAQVKQLEGELLLRKLKPDDHLVLLDEKGRSFPSVHFANHLDRLLQRPARRLIFHIGGAFGCSEAVQLRADEQLSLSPMTFPHQLVRLLLLEQLYRAMTILRNEPYHNE
jgi:23S rRNA (pseudouridine1915-N3)-methyltransferase